MRFRRRRGGGLQFGREKKKLNVPLIKEILIFAAEVVIVLAIAFVFVHYLGMRTRVIGNAMEETFTDGDQVLVDKFVYFLASPKANDIIVFKPNGNEKSHSYIKRVVGVPGDTVEIREGVLYVNGEMFEEVIEANAMTYAGLAEEPITLSTNEYFVLGDNRNNSEDSRYANIGIVKKDYIEGKVWFQIGPFKKFGFVNKKKK